MNSPRIKESQGADGECRAEKKNKKFEKIEKKGLHLRNKTHIIRHDVCKGMK